ncbi:MAG TPA: energy transducer TonB [Opitutaceae bacterium]|jgi:colicin import membrane protein|nr:energy transducer TonB [Opitutaceae bacterium]
MSAQTPGAYGLSALLHSGAVALVLFFSYASDRLVKDEPKVFELVAGEGDNYAATAAPALGSAGGDIKVEPQAPIPTPQPLPEPPAPTPEPKQQETSPIQPAPETIPAPPKAKSPKPPKPVDLVASLKHAEDRRKKKLEDKYKKQQEADAKRQAAMAKRIDAKGIREGVIGGSSENTKGGAGGKALTREEGTELQAYFAELLMRIKESHTPPEGVADTLSAKVELFVAADGSISHVKITSSSGNAEFDRSVVEACQHTRSIGARPDGKSETVSFTFKMREDETS